MNKRQVIKIGSSQLWIAIVLSLSITISLSITGLAGEENDEKARQTLEVEMDATVSEIADKADDNKDVVSDLSRNTIPTKAIDETLARMSLEEKVAQLFIISPEALTGANGVTMAGSVTEEAYSNYPVGGIIYMEPNIQSWNQTSQMLSSIQQISKDRIGLPLFLAVDEEGGRVSRVSGRLEGVPYITGMLSVGSTGDSLQAYETGKTIGDYLSNLGFNVDFAPVADVLTNSINTVIGSRSFGSDPQLVSDMVSKEVQGLREQGVCATLKHFPGHGNTSEDSHHGFAVSYKTREELNRCELLPFESGINAGAEFVMVGHIVMPNVTGDDTPASLSSTV